MIIVHINQLTTHTEKKKKKAFGKEQSRKIKVCVHGDKGTFHPVFVSLSEVISYQNLKLDLVSSNDGQRSSSSASSSWETISISQSARSLWHCALTPPGSWVDSPGRLSGTSASSCSISSPAEACRHKQERLSGWQLTAIQQRRIMWEPVSLQRRI